MIWSYSSSNSHYVSHTKSTGSVSGPRHSFPHLKSIPLLTRWASSYYPSKDNAAFPLWNLPWLPLLSPHPHPHPIHLRWIKYSFCFQRTFYLFFVVIIGTLLWPGGLFLLDREFLKRIEIFLFTSCLAPRLSTQLSSKKVLFKYLLKC